MSGKSEPFSADQTSADKKQASTLKEQGTKGPFARRAFSLKELAELTECQLVGDPKLIITGVADLEAAAANEVSFLANSLYKKALASSQAGAVFIDKEFAASPLLPAKNFLISPHPSLSFQKVIELFLSDERLQTGFDGIHPTAVIHETAILAKEVAVGPYAVIDQYATVQAGTKIGAHAYIGPSSSIGSDCVIHSHAVIREGCTLGNQVIVQPGAVIGACGFGYFTDHLGRHHKLQQLGSVEVADQVEIGANTTIDRARFTATKIGRGSKIDNLVMIAHGVEIGMGNIIVSQVGIAGSTKTGSHVVLGGQVGVVGHIQIADQVMVAAGSGVVKSLKMAKEKYGGTPAIPLWEYNRCAALFRKLPKLFAKFNEK